MLFDCLPCVDDIVVALPFPPRGSFKLYANNHGNHGAFAGACVSDRAFYLVGSRFAEPLSRAIYGSNTPGEGNPAVRSAWLGTEQLAFKVRRGWGCSLWVLLVKLLHPVFIFPPFPRWKNRHG